MTRDTAPTAQVGNLPTPFARQLTGVLMAQAELSDDAAAYWQSVLALAIGAMSAHQSPADSTAALETLLAASRHHRDEAQATAH